MNFDFNACSINVLPPISDISVNKNNVAFKDSNSKQYVNLKSSPEAKKFVIWLLSF